MATYYFEGEKILAPLTISSNEPMYDVDTISLKKQRASQGAQRWELSFNIVSEDPTNLLVNTISGFDSTNTMIMPQLNKIENNLTVSGTLSVSSATAGTNSVVISKVGVSGIIPKGYFIKFSNHNKIYMVLNELDFEGTGTLTCNFYPSLTEDLTGSETVATGDDVTITYYRDISDLKGITYTDGVLSDIGTINIIEAL